MGYFTITLPNNIAGEVRWGKVAKLDNYFFRMLMPWKTFNKESKTGYIIKLRSAFVNETEYRLFQTKDGHWYQDAEGRLEIDEPIAIAIRRAIEDHERAYK